jgi:hypothetical protein
MSGAKKIEPIPDLRTDLAATHRAFYADEGNTIEALKAQSSIYCGVRLPSRCIMMMAFAVFLGRAQL